MSEGNRNSQSVRLQKLIEILMHSKFGYSINELHSQFAERGYNVGARTIRRDVEALEAAGYPLITSGDKASGVRWRLESASAQKVVMPIKQSALMGLYLLRGLSTNLEESPFYTDVEEFFRTIELKIGEKGQQYLNELAESIKFSEQMQFNTQVNKEILETLQAACIERQLLKVTYESTARGLQSRTLGPHALYFDRGSFYLLAEDMESKSIKTYALARFSEAECLEEEYPRDPIDPKQFFEKSFGIFEGSLVKNVALEVDQSIAAFVSETIWHSSQAVEPLKNGNTMLRFQLALTPDFVNWVMGYGAKVYVHEPVELQNEIRLIASAVTKSYGPKKTG